MVMPRALTTEPTRRCFACCDHSTWATTQAQTHAEIDACREAAANRRALESEALQVDFWPAVLRGSWTCECGCCRKGREQHSALFMAGKPRRQRKMCQFMRANGSGTRRTGRPILAGRCFNCAQRSRRTKNRRYDVRTATAVGRASQLQETAYSQAKGRLAQLGEHQPFPLAVYCPDCATAGVRWTP